MFSVKFNNVYIKNWYTISNKLDARNLKNINYVFEDYYFGEDSFEKCEIKMINHVVNNLKSNNISLIIGSDLSNQLANINKALSKYNISFIGLYSACSSFVLSLILSGIILNNSNEEILCITSNHSKTAERQFRFPNEYSNIMSSYQTLTITSSVGCIVSKNKSNYKIKCATIGEIIDSLVIDSKNMGAVMAPACANVLYEHLKKFNKKITDYDLILTGDLGNLGLKILKKVLLEVYNIKANNIKDAGSIIYKGINNGGSGPSVLPTVLFNKMIYKYKKILIIGTGSLHNTTLVNQGLSIPAIAHCLEVEND